MRHAFGAVYFPDGKTFYYGWKETTSGEGSCLHDLEQDVVDHWFKPLEGQCTCGRDEEVDIMFLGDGAGHWPGKACRHCRVITQSQYGLGWKPDTPSWSPWLKRSGNLQFWVPPPVPSEVPVPPTFIRRLGQMLAKLIDESGLRYS